MSSSLLASCIGQQPVFLPGHFDVSVVLGDARPPLPSAQGTAQAGGSDGSAGYECGVCLPEGSLEEAVITLPRGWWRFLDRVLPNLKQRPLWTPRSLDS